MAFLEETWILKKMSLVKPSSLAEIIVLCVEVVGIPSSVADDQLENTVCKVLQYIGASITNEKIESRHRFNKNTDRTIVKFLRRKDYKQIMRLN